jgi:DNA-binding transcriptional ArsR family regulator
MICVVDLYMPGRAAIQNSPGVQILLTGQIQGCRITFNNMNMITEDTTIDSANELQTQIFKVLTHPARISILDILRDGEHCVCHMEAFLGLRQAYLSQQLSVPREAGLVQDRRDGWNIFYRVVDPRIYEVLDAVRRITGQANIELKKSGVVCNCPHCSGQLSTSPK